MRRYLAIASALAATLGVGLVAAPAQAKARRVHPKIVTPKKGSVLCAGGNLLLGRSGGTSPRLRGAWQYAVGDGGFKRVTGPSTIDVVGSGFYNVAWDSSAVPSGRVRLRLRIHGRGRGTAKRSFLLDRPPLPGPVDESYNPETATTTLSLPEASDSDGQITRVRWFLGDGSTVDGPTVNHQYDFGDHVVTAQVTDDHGCTGETTVQEGLPPPQPKRPLDVVKYCDPTGRRTDGDDSWPAVPTHGFPEGKKPHGRVHNKRTVIGYGFETRFTVFGNADECDAYQLILGTWVYDEKLPSGRHMRKGFRAGRGAKYSLDGYTKEEQNAFRKVTPNADGTQTISWYDLPSVYTGENPEFPDLPFDNGEIDLHFVDVVSGSEAPVDHTETEGDGESAYFKFHVCASSNPPNGTADHSFAVQLDEGPDAALPAQYQRASLAPKDLEEIPAKDRRFNGCGPKGE